MAKSKGYTKPSKPRRPKGMFVDVFDESYELVYVKPMTKREALSISYRLRDDVMHFTREDDYAWLLEGAIQIGVELKLPPAIAFMAAYTMLVQENDYIH